jgi:outer membrane lipoprotein SlyB
LNIDFNMHTLSKILLTIIIFSTLPSCTPNVSVDTYAIGSVGQVNRAIQGVIISARPVKISGTESGVGAVSGAGAGAIGGATLGGDAAGAAVGLIGGAVVGGVAGALTEKELTKQTGVEYVVKTNNGALISLVQSDDVAFEVNQRVIVVYGSRSRIIDDPDS